MIQFRYNLNDRPSFGAMLLYGLQWLMISIPVVLTSTFIAPEGQTLMFVLPHLSFFAVGAICLTVFGFVLLGDGLRDLLDPRLN